MYLSPKGRSTALLLRPRPKTSPPRVTVVAMPCGKMNRTTSEVRPAGQRGDGWMEFCERGTKVKLEKNSKKKTRRRRPYTKTRTSRVCPGNLEPLSTSAIVFGGSPTRANARERQCRFCMETYKSAGFLFRDDFFQVFVCVCRYTFQNQGGGLQVGV